MRHRGQRRPRLVLLVDDYPDNREMYGTYLAREGFRIAEARNGVEAIERARALLPDVILMDLSLPVLDGWEATRQLKQEEATRAIPVIALSGHALPVHERRARQAGCDSFVEKPCLPEALVREIRRVLDAALEAPAPARSTHRRGR